jgi:hypothetical protein
MSAATGVCAIRREPDYQGVDCLELHPEPPPTDYRQALTLADAVARERLGENYMLLSWYDRDRDFEAPQHVSECHADSAIPGYVDYGLSHGARLKLDIAGGRFVFFYLPLDAELG